MTLAASTEDGAPAAPKARLDVSAMADADLARCHDRATFLELYDRYVDRIEHFVAARTMSANVEDIVSTTFERALARRSTFQPNRGTYAAWLFTIARHAIADSYRSQPQLVEGGEAPDSEDPEPGPEQAAVTQEDRLRVRKALQGLTAEQRDALALRFAAELSFSEVGHAMRKSEPAAKMLVQRGLTAMRRLLGGDNHGA